MRFDSGTLTRLANEKADHFLYRCYDNEGVLLYIGCTKNVKQRMAVHACPSTLHNASWWLSVCMDRCEVDGPYKGLSRGKKAENAAILAEQPVFNTQGRGHSIFIVRNEIARYLIAQGHSGIARDTACTCRAGLYSVDEYCAAHEGQAVA